MLGTYRPIVTTNPSLPTIPSATALADLDSALVWLGQNTFQGPTQLKTPSPLQEARKAWAIDECRSAASFLESAVIKYPDHSPEIAVKHATLQRAMATAQQLSAPEVESAMTTTAPAPEYLERYPGKSRLFFFLYEALQNIAKHAGLGVEFRRGFLGLGKPEIIVTAYYSYGLPVLSSILDYLNLTSALYIPVDDILIDYDLRTGTQRRVISVSRRNKSDEDDRPIINVIAKTSFDAYGTIITFKPTADNGVTQNHRSHLLLQDDGDRNEGWLSEYLYRFLADHNPIPDSARAVTRTFELSDSQQLAITATRSPTWWYRGLLHPTFRSLSVKMIQGQATIEEQLAFVGARLLGAQFTKAEGQEQFSAHLASGAIFCSSWRQASRRPGDYMLDVVSAVPFDNGPAMQAYDQVFSRLITGRLLDVDVTNFQPDFDDDEEMRPNVDQTILIREEALPIESGTDIGGIFAEDERHQRFHLFLNGPSVQQVPVAITINTGGSVQNWKISLSIAPSKHNTATIIPLLSFIGQLLGVTFERGEIGGAFSGMSLEEVYRAEKNGLGGVLLEKQSQIGDPSFPIHTYNISFFPNDGFDNQTAIDFMKALFARIRGFASENAH